MQAKALDDLLGELGRVSAQAEVPIVGAPFGDLNAIDGRAGARMGDVEHRDPFAGVAQRLPEWPSPDRRGRRQAPFVAPGNDLLPAMEPGLHRRAAREE